MKLDKILNFKKVRCVKGYDGCLKVGKEYDVIEVSAEIKIKDDEGSSHYWESDYFEPVLDSAENPLQEIELTPELETEASEPKFKAGDKVYLFGTDYIEEITKIIGANIYLAGADFDASVSIKEICHATQENYERLQATFPHIEFEQPHKELKGSDLARVMLDKGWNLVPCVVSDTSDNEALLNDDCQLIDEWYNGYFECNGNRFKYAVPFDPKTGEPLTESILND